MRPLPPVSEPRPNTAPEPPTNAPVPLLEPPGPSLRSGNQAFNVVPKTEFSLPKENRLCGMFVLQNGTPPCKRQ